MVAGGPPAGADEDGQMHTGQEPQWRSRAAGRGRAGTLVLPQPLSASPAGGREAAALLCAAGGARISGPASKLTALGFLLQTAVDVFRRIILEAEKIDGAASQGKSSCSVM